MTPGEIGIEVVKRVSREKSAKSVARMGDGRMEGCRTNDAAENVSAGKGLDWTRVDNYLTEPMSFPEVD